MASRPCKILYVNHAAKPSGAEFALIRLLSAIDRDRFTPIIAFGEDGPAVQMARGLGIEAHVLPLDATVRRARKDTLRSRILLSPAIFARTAHYAARIAAFARRNGVSLIHTNTIKAHVYGLLAGRLANLPVIWHVRDYIDPTYFPAPAVKVIRLLARYGPRHILAVSRSVLERLALPASCLNSTVVLDGLADHELESTYPAGNVDHAPEIPRIGILGRIAPWKGQHVFLDAAAKVLRAGCEAEFQIIGTPLFDENAYEAGLRGQIEQLGLGSRVHFTGFAHDVPAALQPLDILVHASTSGEPFGQVIIEGMAAGKPVIASRGGGVPEIISHGKNGLLTEMGDSRDLSEAMLFLLRHPAEAKRLARAGQQHVRQNFRVANGAQRIQEIYASLLKPKRG